MAAIFVKMQAIYGHKMTSAFSSPKILNTAIEQWTYRTMHLNAVELERGLNNWRGDWPPTLKEFIETAKPRTKKAYQEYKALPGKPSNKAAARAEMQRCREYLALADPAPPRSDKDRYMRWANEHRARCKMRPVVDIRADGSLVVAGDR